MLRIGNRYILNGNMEVMQAGIINEPGIIIQYSGHEHAVERLNTSQPTSVDLILEVIQLT